MPANIFTDEQRQQKKQQYQNEMAALQQRRKFSDTAESALSAPSNAWNFVKETPWADMSQMSMMLPEVIGSYKMHQGLSQLPKPIKDFGSDMLLGTDTFNNPPVAQANPLGPPAQPQSTPAVNGEALAASQQQQMDKMLGQPPPQQPTPTPQATPQPQQQFQQPAPQQQSGSWALPQQGADGKDMWTNTDMAMRANDALSNFMGFDVRKAGQYGMNAAMMQDMAGFGNWQRRQSDEALSNRLQQMGQIYGIMSAPQQQQIQILDALTRSGQFDPQTQAAVSQVLQRLGLGTNNTQQQGGQPAQGAAKPAQQPGQGRGAGVALAEGGAVGASSALAPWLINKVAPKLGPKIGGPAAWIAPALTTYGLSALDSKFGDTVRENPIMFGAGAVGAGYGAKKMMAPAAAATPASTGSGSMQKAPPVLSGSPEQQASEQAAATQAKHNAAFGQGGPLGPRKQLPGIGQTGGPPPNAQEMKMETRNPLGTAPVQPTAPVPNAPIGGTPTAPPVIQQVEKVPQPGGGTIDQGLLPLGTTMPGMRSTVYPQNPQNPVAVGSQGVPMTASQQIQNLSDKSMLNLTPQNVAPITGKPVKKFKGKLPETGVPF